MNNCRCNRCGHVPCKCCDMESSNNSSYFDSAQAPVYMFGEHNRGGMDVVATGSNVSLPDYYFSSAGIIADDSFSTFTILVPGIYRIMYHINLEVPDNLKTRLTLNGNQVDSSLLFPVVPERHFAAEVFLSINKGDVISLQLFDKTEHISFSLGIGATLSIVKES